MEALKSDPSSQAKIWKLIYGFADSLVLRCAAQLGIADAIHSHGGPLSLSELSSRLHIPSVDRDRLRRLMRYLVHLDLFTAEAVAGEPRYGLAPASKYLVSGWDQCVVPALLTITDQDMMAPWQFLKEALASGGETAFELALGKNIWEYMSEQQGKNKLFNEAMACDTRLLTAALVSECRDVFAGINSLVDVGGGTGTAVRAIVKAFPKIKCIVYDLPHVIADSPDHPEVTRMEGDMFKSVPSADAILLKCILHDWADEECVKILKNCKEAVPREGGKVIIVDIVLDAASDHPYSHLRQCMDLDMLLNTGGKERTEAEWEKLIYDAGFKSYKIKHISATQSVIEAFPY